MRLWYDTRTIDWSNTDASEGFIGQPASRPLGPTSPWPRWALTAVNKNTQYVELTRFPFGGVTLDGVTLGKVRWGVLCIAEKSEKAHQPLEKFKSIQPKTTKGIATSEMKKTEYLSVSFCIYLYLSVSIGIYLYLSVSICIYLYLSVSICIYLYLSVSICIYW